MRFSCVNQSFEPILDIGGGEGDDRDAEDGGVGGGDVEKSSGGGKKMKSETNIGFEDEDEDEDGDGDGDDDDEDEDWDGHGDAGIRDAANRMGTLKKGKSKQGKMTLDVGVRHGDGDGGGGGDKAKCSRGGKKLHSNMGAKVNIDVEDGDGDGDGEDIDDMFGEIDEGSLHSGPIQLGTDTIMETQVLSTATIHLLSTLAGSCRAVTLTSSTIFNNASKVLTSLVTGHSWDSIHTTFQTDSLFCIAERCGISENLLESSQLIFSLNLIQFRTKIES